MENPLKNAVHRHCHKNHTPEFLPESGTVKNYTHGKKTTALTNFLVRNHPQNFWLSRLGGRLNLETFQKFKGKEEKNQNQDQDQIQQLVKPLKIRRFHDVFEDFTKWVPNFLIFPRKLASIFYKNKNIN